MSRVDRRVAVGGHDQIAVEYPAIDRPRRVDGRGISIVPAEPIGRDRGGEQLLTRRRHLQPLGVPAIESIAASDRSQPPPTTARDRWPGRRRSRRDRDGVDREAEASSPRAAPPSPRNPKRLRAPRSSLPQRTGARLSRFLLWGWLGLVERVVEVAPPPCRSPSAGRPPPWSRSCPAPASPSRAPNASVPTLPMRTRSNLPGVVAGLDHDLGFVQPGLRLRIDERLRLEAGQLRQQIVHVRLCDVMSRPTLRRDLPHVWIARLGRLHFLELVNLRTAQARRRRCAGDRPRRGGTRRNPSCGSR